MTHPTLSTLDAAPDFPLFQLARNPDSLTPKKLWSAVGREARGEAIAAMLDCDCSLNHADLLRTVADTLHMRLQTLLSRSAVQTAAEMEGRDIPLGVLRTFLAHYAMITRWDVVGPFLTDAKPGEGSTRVVRIGGGIEIELDRVRHAADRMWARHGGRALPILLTLYLIERQIQDELGSAIRAIAERPEDKRFEQLRNAIAAEETNAASQELEVEIEVGDEPEVESENEQPAEMVAGPEVVMEVTSEPQPRQPVAQQEGEVPGETNPQESVVAQEQAGSQAEIEAPLEDVLSESDVTQAAPALQESAAGEGLQSDYAGSDPEGERHDEGSSDPEEIAGLAGELRTLADALRAAADAAEAGRVPGTGTLAAIVRVRAAYASISERLRARLGGLEDEEAGLEESVTTLEDWLGRIEALEAGRQSESLRREALRILAVVQRIESTPPEAIAPAHEDARLLTDQLESDGPDRDALAESLVGGVHVLSALHDLVVRPGELPDDQKMALGTRIGEAYSIQLAMVAALGRLRLVEPGPEVREPPTASSETATEGAPEDLAPKIGARGLEVAEASKTPVGAPIGLGAPALEVQEDAPSPAETAPLPPTPVEAQPSAAPLAGVASPVPEESEPLLDPASAAAPTTPVAAPVHTPEAEQDRDDLSGLSLHEMAARYLKTAPESQPGIARVISLSLLAEGRRGLAYHVGQVASSDPDAVPIWLLRSLVVSSLLSQPSGPLEDLLRDDFAAFTEDLFEDAPPENRQGLALLVAAAALRPALLAPASLAAAPLSRARVHLGAGLNSLWAYCQSVADFSSKGTGLDPILLKRVQSRAAWEAALGELAERTAQWAAHAPHMTILYPPATRIWIKWQEKGDIIHALLQPVRTNDRGALEVVRAEIERLSDTSELRRLVDRADRELSSRKASATIDFKAYTQLLARVREAVSLAREWVELHDNAPGQASNYRIQQAAQVSSELATRSRAVLEELAALAAQAGSVLQRASVAAMGEAIESMNALLDGGSPRVVREVPPGQVLNAGLLRIPEIELEPDWTCPESVDIVTPLMRALAQGPLVSWSQAFEGRVATWDFVGARLILQRMSVLRSETEEEITRLEGERRRRLTEAQGTLWRLTDAAERRVDQAVMFGVLSDSERDSLLDSVRAVITAAGGPSEALGRMRAELASVDRVIDERQQEMVRELEADLGRHNIGPDHPGRARINAVLARGDVLTAREYIHHVERGHPIEPESEPADVFRSFFPSMVQELDRFRVVNSIQLIDDIRASQPFASIDMSRVPEPQARIAADAVTGWYKVKGQRGSAENNVTRAVFTFLGFNVLNVSTMESKGISRGSRVWQDVITQPVRDRAQCPVAHYGSRAAGSFTSDRARYRVLWIWDEPSAEDLISAVGDTAHEGPTFVFYLGKLNEDRRRSLARLSRKDRRTFLVVDEVLLLYLCGEPDARMPVLFRCALPFTYLDPYVSTASLVPPEVFYGREEDREKIVDPYGSCFIYGGRQLGKTALLRDVERRFHDPAVGRVALYLDLKAEGIGFNRPLEDLLPLLAEKLKEFGVFPTSLSNHVNPDRVYSEIRTWISDQANRRVLILLDESDRFLEGDQDFVFVLGLKKLMEQTDRRFKVVLAGLHNVQRTTRIGNNPLAHLGEPRCIGPLFENLEWRQARDLVREPLAAVGYRFESEDLVVRILSQTNYYPSLLQLYCQQLLKHVNRPNLELFDSRAGPPYVITAKHVEDAYQSQELWQRIRERFHWTLDLDPRYRLLALLIAHYGHAAGPDMLRQGFLPSKLRTLALEWWDQGFAEDRSEDTFRALLDEMVGLGILRQTDAGRYRMRTGNVGLLLGTPEDIDAALVTLAEQEAPAAYEAQSFRRPIQAPRRPDYLRSPLTALQESEVQRRENGVVVAFGTEAAGLSDLRAGLPQVMGERFFVPLTGIFDRAAFRRELDGLNNRAPHGVTLLMVGADCPWTEQWVRDAAQKVAALKSKTNFVRVLFVADPQHAWQLLGPDSAGWASLCRQRKIVSISLRPWLESALRAWLDDLQVPAKLAHDYLRTFLSHTGGWPYLNYELMGMLSPNAPGRWDREMLSFEATWNDARTVAARKAAFGLERPEAASVLSLLAAGPSTAEDLALVAEMPLPAVQQVLAWLDSLSLAWPVAGETWQLDETVNLLLKVSGLDAGLLVEPARA
jgi:hypothetical protein